MESEQTANLGVSDRCRKHGADIEFYCVTCKQMICKKCITEHSKDSHQCLFLEDYGRQNLITSFDDIMAQIKKNSEEINLSPVESKKAATELIDSLKALRKSMQDDVSSLTQEIEAMERMKVSSFAMPNMEELVRVIEQCRKSLESEMQKSSGIAHSLEIIQATKDLLNGLSSNTLELRKAREQVAKAGQELQVAGLLKNISQLRLTLKRVTQNPLVAYAARVGLPISAHCIYGIKEQEAVLLSYDLTTKMLQEVKTPMEIPAEPTLTQVGERLYLTGGGQYLDTNYEYVESTGQMTKKAPMSLGKKWHSTVVIDRNEFVTLGGYNNTYKHLNVCERYLTERDTWVDMPKLNESKQSMAACLFEKKEIYVFGGYSGSRHKTIEMLVISPMAEEWVVIKPETEGILPPFSCGAAAQISMSEILILRGNSTHDSYIYSTKEKAIRKAQELKSKDSFLLQTMYPAGSWLAVMGYYGGMHLFDFKSQAWDEVEYVMG